MATTDIFLKIDGIPGESEDKTHKGEIDVLSWSFGASNSGSHAYGGGGGTGKVAMQDFHFTMKHNKASALLFMRCCDGKHIPKAVLYARKATGDGGQKEFLELYFDILTISSYQTGGSGGGDPVPTESISFAFEKLKISYKPQDSKGILGAAVENGWDVKRNEKV